MIYQSDFEALGIELPNWKRPGPNGDVKTYCPACHGTRRHKHDQSLSVNMYTGLYQCWNPGCDFRGGVGKEENLDYRKFGTTRPNRNYVKPEPEEVDNPLPAQTRKYFESRGIDLDVVERRGIYRTDQGMVFPFFRDGEVVNRQTRTADKQFRMVSGAELIFYGLDDCKDADEIVIVEGMMDALAIETATGFKAILSVPNGASVGNMSYMESAEEIFSRVRTVVLAVDGDEPGQKLKDELASRIGKEMCLEVVWPEGCKDANDVLLKHGKAALADLLSSAQDLPDSGVVRPAQLRAQVKALYDSKKVRGELLDWGEVDQLYSVVRPELCIVSASPGSGKSSLVDNIMVRLAMKNPDEWRFVVFSPENHPPAHHVTKLASIYIGKPFRRGVPGRMSEAERELAVTWIDKHFTILNPGEDSLDDLLGMAKSVHRRLGVTGLVIDPWNQVTRNYEKGQTETDYVKDSLKKIKKFLGDHNMSGWLVAHPPKLQKDSDGNYSAPGLYDVAGSANFANAADVMIALNRDRSVENGLTTFMTNKIRNQPHTGVEGTAVLQYDVPTGRFLIPDEPAMPTPVADLESPWDNPMLQPMSLFSVKQEGENE